MVLIQGLGFDRSGLGAGGRRPGEHFGLLLVDNRGSGASDPPTGRSPWPTWRATCVAVLDHAAVPRTHVVGISLGGMVAQEFAIDYRDRVGALVLAATTPGWPFAYPMPATSLALLTATRRLPAEVAMRRHVENALGRTPSGTGPSWSSASCGPSATGGAPPAGTRSSAPAPASATCDKSGSPRPPW